MYKVKKNLVLTGMMGSGKSTIGKNLSKNLKMDFADTDNIIEQKLSLPVSKIFEIKGEEFFRMMEEKEIQELINKTNIIIALGGGTFMNKTIREKIKINAVSVWLDLDISELYKRTRINKKRPLLIDMTKDDLKKLYDKRKKIYSLADFKIDCNNKNKDEITEEIKEFYKNAYN